MILTKRIKKKRIKTMTNTTVELVSPYAAAKLVNAILDEYELKNIPPQMMYNYVAKGYIPSTDKKINVEDLHEWTIKYLSKKGITVEETETDENPDQLTLDDIETPETV